MTSPGHTTCDWLVLDRDDSVESMAPVLDGGPRPTWLGAPVMADGQPPALAVYPVVTAPMTRREAVAVAPDSSSPSPWSCARSSPRRSCSRSPRTPPTTSASPATCSRAAGSSPTPCGASRRRRSCSRGPPSRCGCRSRRSSRPSRWRSSASRSPRPRCRASLVGALVPVLPGGWPGTSPPSAACRPGAPALVALGAGLTAAVYLPLRAQLGPARLDDAVRGHRARPRAMLMTRVAARPARRPPDRPAPDRARRCCSASAR